MSAVSKNPSTGGLHIVLEIKDVLAIQTGDGWTARPHLPSFLEDLFTADWIDSVSLWTVLSDAECSDVYRRVLSACMEDLRVKHPTRNVAFAHIWTARRCTRYVGPT